ncbi:radical SAM family heme chaperone HemW [uncultured Corynebacterium sp.]|uniref:radical SAM family heme chaperone HemW n=1 Tax=uncultured Corynebacterium sp. TaxID=159447 RepID=UPI0025E23260|nr:radical SAM family heme chaperone HemW [uncultured Corynebacterium sp.]
MHGLYIHVPFCSTRCGYCDFNTYTPQELSAADGSAVDGNTIPGYLDALERELEVAAEVWDYPGEVQTVFFGGGTPSMLGHEGLARALNAARRTVGLAADAEVTTEANPESTSPEFFTGLREAGFNRISLGMQSAMGHVLKVLERQHTPGRPIEATREAKQAGFEHINLDVIYGTPTETDDDLRRTLDAVLEADVDHVSAYSLIVEDGTAMARKVRRGELPAPDEDTLADRYDAIDARLRQAGFHWYEVSNWAKPGGECQHNLIYWRSGQWWGAGPGAHGCVRLRGEDISESGLVRLVNAKRPATYWNGLLGEAEGASTRKDGLPVPGSVVTTERLSNDDLRTEQVMLRLRLAEGLDLAELADGTDKAHSVNSADPARNAELERVIERYAGLGLLDKSGERLRLTDKGRYLADGIVTDIVLALGL